MFTINSNHLAGPAAAFNANVAGNFRRLAVSAIFLVFLFSFSALVPFAEAQSEEDTGLSASDLKNQPEAVLPVAMSAPTEYRSVPSTFVVPISVADVSGIGIFAFQFNIVYDPAVIDPAGPNFGCSTAGTIAGAAGLTPTCNVLPDGTLRVAVSGISPMNGSGPILNVTFTTDGVARGGHWSPLTFQSAYFFNATGPVNNLPTDGRITLVSPTAAQVPVGGIVRAADGTPVRFARLSLTDQSGYARGALSNDFGYYRFDDVPVGESYVFSARAKNYLFAPRLVSVADEITDLNMTAEP